VELEDEPGRLHRLEGVEAIEQVEQVLEKQELDFIAAYRVSFLISY
jgi:hypothetical protein